MLDAPLRRAVAPSLDRLGGRLAATGVPPLALTAGGFVVGVGACVAAALGAWPTALVLWLLNRALDGLDGPVARHRGVSGELGGFFDILADFTVYGGFVVGVAVAVPSARVACAVLLLAYYASGTAFLALSSMLERRSQGLEAAVGSAAGRGDGRSLLFVGGIAEGTETIVAYVLFCLLPGHVELLAWVFAAAVATTAVQRAALAGHLLRLPAPAGTQRDPAPPTHEER